MSIDSRKVLVIVPARGGSKGIRRKNLKKIRGRSLVELVGLIVQDLEFVDRAVVSTDDDEIAAVGKTVGLEVPFRRPQDLAGDFIGDIQVLQHALQQTESHYAETYEVIIMLQPTTPTRQVHEVKAAVRSFQENGLDSLWTVSRTNSKFHPKKQLSLSNDGHLEYFDPICGPEIVARQQLGTVYHRNGVAYVLSRDCLMEQKTLLGNNGGALILADKHISIDTEDDFALAQKILSSR